MIGPMLYELYERFASALPKSAAAKRRSARSVRRRYADYVKAKHSRRARR